MYNFFMLVNNSFGIDGGFIKGKLPVRLHFVFPRVFAI